MDIKEMVNNYFYRHPWEFARKRIIFSQLKRKYPFKQILDFGAGDLFISDNINSQFDCELIAIDKKFEIPLFSRKYLLSSDIGVVEDSSIDIVLLLDVLEHLKDEEFVLTDIKEKMNNNGTLFVMVPAFYYLYSEHDKRLGHIRRYNLEELRLLLEKNEFEIHTSFYFFNILWIIRLFGKFLKIKKLNESQITGWQFSKRNIITRIVTNILFIDFCVNQMLSKINITFPGLSIFVECKKSA